MKKFIYCLLFQIGYLFASQQSSAFIQQIKTISQITQEIQPLTEALLSQLPKITQDMYDQYKNHNDFDDQQDPQITQLIQSVLQNVSKPHPNTIIFHHLVNGLFILKLMLNLPDDKFQDIYDKFKQLCLNQNQVQDIIDTIEQDIATKSLQDQKYYYTQKIKYLDQSNFILKYSKKYDLNYDYQKSQIFENEIEYLQNKYKKLYSKCKDASPQLTDQDFHDALTLANTQNTDDLKNQFNNDILQEYQNTLSKIKESIEKDAEKVVQNKIEKQALKDYIKQTIRFSLGIKVIAKNRYRYKGRIILLKIKANSNLWDTSIYDSVNDMNYQSFNEQKLKLYDMLDCKSFFTVNNIKFPNNQGSTTTQPHPHNPQTTPQPTPRPHPQPFNTPFLGQTDSSSGNPHSGQQRQNSIPSQSKETTLTEKNQKDNSKVILYLGISAIGVIAIGTALYFIFQPKP